MEPSVLRPRLNETRLVEPDVPKVGVENHRALTEDRGELAEHMS